MADFLTSMIQRTLGLLPVVQPIIASKYVTEAMGAAGALALLDPFPGSMSEESFEHWEELAEQLPPAALPQPLMPRGVLTPTPALPSAPPTVASPREQPSTAPKQRAVPAPVSTRAALSSSETTGGNPGKPPSPLIPQPQTSPERNESQPLVSRSPVDNRSFVRKDVPPIASSSSEVVSPQLQISDSQENPHFATTPMASSVPTTKPRRSDQSTGSTPLVPAQSGAMPTIPQLPQADAQVVLYKESVEQQPNSPFPTTEESSFTGALLTRVHSSLPPSAGTSFNPPINRRNVAQARPERIESEAEQGYPYTPQYTKRNTADLYRVGAVYAPALFTPALVSRVLSGQALPSRAADAESDLIEPLLPVTYTPIQSRRVETPAAGKRAEAQLSETPSAPTIRVTIGRIEVRAVTPPTPVSPAPVRVQRARPALSLDDYLKQRNGGQQ